MYITVQMFPNLPQLSPEMALIDKALLHKGVDTKQTDPNLAQLLDNLFRYQMPV